MATEIIVDKQIRVYAHFRSLDEDDEYVYEDPDTVTITVSQAGNVVATPSATKEEDGVYYLDYTFTETGQFNIEFVGDYVSDARTAIVSEDFSVVDSFSTTVTLGSTQEFFFAGTLTPMYVDPEEFLVAFPEATYLDIAELVVRFSLEVDQIIGTADPNFTVYEYVRAAVACALSRRFDYGFSSVGETITLGDLTVSSQPYGKSVVNRGNASNPCELAATLREELIRSYGAQMRAVVSGTKFKNPMPKRQIKHQHIRIEPRNNLK